MPSKNNQSHKEIKAITNLTENSFVVSSFIYTMNDKQSLKAIQHILERLDTRISSIVNEDLQEPTADDYTEYIVEIQDVLDGQPYYFDEY